MASMYHCLPAVPFTRKHLRLCPAVCLAMLLLPGPAVAANVTVNVSSNPVRVSSNAPGMHPSVYDNQNGN
jgi:hypothetical protein